MSNLPSIDKLREQRWDIVGLLMAKHQQLIPERLMRVVIDYPPEFVHDDDTKPDFVVKK